jgi:hypothetical protein
VEIAGLNKMRLQYIKKKYARVFTGQIPDALGYQRRKKKKRKQEKYLAVWYVRDKPLTSNDQQF